MFVKDLGIIGQGLNSQTANANYVGSLEDAQRSITDQCSAQTLPMQTDVDAQTAQNHNRNRDRHVAAHAASGFVAIHSTRSDGVTGHDLITFANHVGLAHGSVHRFAVARVGQVNRELAHRVQTAGGFAQQHIDALHCLLDLAGGVAHAHAFGGVQVLADLAAHKHHKAARHHGLAQVVVEFLLRLGGARVEFADAGHGGWCLQWLLVFIPAVASAGRFEGAPLGASATALKQHGAGADAPLRHEKAGVFQASIKQKSQRKN